MTDEIANDDGAGLDGSDREVELSRAIGDQPPSRAVVRAVSSLKNTPVLELEPLYEVVDPEHLDAVWRSSTSGGVGRCAVSFEYGGCAVSVFRDEVRVRRIEDGPD